MAELPNECWQSGFTQWRLADGTDAEILVWLDDHSRYALSVTAHRPVTGPIVTAEFRSAVARNTPWCSPPASRAGAEAAKGLETECARLHITQKNSRPNRPTTCGKVERDCCMIRWHWHLLCGAERSRWKDAHHAQALPHEFSEDVIRVARTREPGVLLKDIAADFGSSESCLTGWLKAADVEHGIKPGTAAAGQLTERCVSNGPVGLDQLV